MPRQRRGLWEGLGEGELKKELTRIAKELRNNLTEAEKYLWYMLRCGNLGVKFRRQTIIGQYIVDFVCFEKKLIIEVDGGQHAQNQADKLRDRWLKDQGFEVLRFWNHNILANREGVLEKIVEHLSPLPSPPHKGGGNAHSSSNDSGIILISVLWILAILSLLALSLSRQNAIEISLMQYGIGKTRAYAAARAGINYCLYLLDKLPTDKDTLYASGIKIPQGKTAQDYFQGVKVGEGEHVEISYMSDDYRADKKTKYYGLADESRRINVNSLNEADSSVFSFLMQHQGVDKVLADSIAAAAADWRVKKNRPFDAPQELMMVKAMTPEIYGKIKDYLTVFPQQQSALKINFNTASEPVVYAVLKEWAMNNSKTDADVSEAMRDIENQRDHGQSAKDAFFEKPWQSLNTEKAESYRIRSVGIDKNSHTRVVIEAVVGQTIAGWAIQSWHRQ